MKLWLLIIFSFSNITLATAQSSTVHVSTKRDPSGLVDAETADRMKAVTAITKRLASRKTVKLVDRPENARVIVTVISVVKEAVWQPTPLAPATPIAPGEPIPEGTRPVLVARAILTSGTFTTSFAEAAGAFRGSAIENLARKIDAWFKANAATLANRPI